MSNSIYPKTSPYYSANIVNNNYLGVLHMFTRIPKNDSDATFEITPQYEYRPDLLSQHLYNNSKLWWVFAARNPDSLGPDPYFNFKSGLTIRIPPLSTLKKTLGI